MATATKKGTAGVDPLSLIKDVARSNANLTVEDPSIPDPVMSTGILGLDLATGIGGIPLGRLIEMYGMESAGKSSTVYHMIAEAQRQGFHAVLFETEGSLDPVYMRRIGVDVDRLVQLTPDHIESLVKTFTDICDSAKANDFKVLFFLDSVASLPAAAQANEVDPMQKFRAVNAQAWNQHMPRIIAKLREIKTSFIFVNQMRESMDQYSAPSTPGGRSIKFGASMRIRLVRKIDPAERKSGEGILGSTIEYTLEKNKSATPYRKGWAYLPASSGVMPHTEAFENGLVRGVILKGVKYDPVTDTLEDKANYFTIEPTPEMQAALSKDLDLMSKAGLDPAIPIVEGKPVSVRFEKNMLAFLESAPNFTASIIERVRQTLVEEREAMSQGDDDVLSMYEKRAKERTQEFSQTGEIATPENDVRASDALAGDLDEFLN